MKIRSHSRACQWGYAPHYSYQEPRLTPVARPLPAASHLSSLSPLSSSPSPFVHSLHAFLCVLTRWISLISKEASDPGRLQEGHSLWPFFFLATFLSPNKCQIWSFFSRCLIVSDDKMPIHFLITICDICIHLAFHIYYFPGGAPSWPV